LKINKISKKLTITAIEKTLTRQRIIKWFNINICESYNTQTKGINCYKKHYVPPKNIKRKYSKHERP